MTKPLTKKEYTSLIKKHYPVVIGGYSGLEYAEPKKVEETVRSILSSLHQKHGKRLLIVSGGTHVGIGMVYKLARKLGLPTLGIVSELASFEEISPDCDAVLFVPDPDQSWDVKTSEGVSLMVQAAKKGEMHYFGGGQVAVREIKEAREQGIPVTIYTEFLPDPEKVRLKTEDESCFVATPTRFV